MGIRGGGGWGIAEDEEFDKGADKDNDRELAKKEALGEGEPTEKLVTPNRKNIFKV